MKICPKCKTPYEYEMVFCLQDGERLVFSSSNAESAKKTEDKTAVLPQTNSILTGKSPSASKTNEPFFENIITPPKANTNLIIGVLVGVIIISSVFLGIWNYNFFAKVDDAPAANSNQNVNLSPTSAEPVLDKKFNEAFYEGLQNQLEIAAAKNGLKPLANTVLPKDGVEIRLYLFPDFYGPIYKGLAVDNSILLLKKDGSGWSGKVVRNLIKPNSAKEKIVTDLNPPVSGWENLWQKLQTGGVLAQPTKSEAQVKTGSALYVVESKSSGKYSYTYFHVPKEKSEIEEERRVAAIFNLIAREFDALDLKAN